MRLVRFVVGLLMLPPRISPPPGWTRLPPKEQSARADIRNLCTKKMTLLAKSRHLN
jgi:hypothetical protein